MFDNNRSINGDERTRNKSISIAIDYATEWVETRALKTNTTIVITKNLYECILTKFRCPLIIVID